jgi:hypothetical protein
LQESASIIEISDDEEFAEAVPIDKSAQAKEGLSYTITKERFQL